MTVGQTSYDLVPAKAFAGMLADLTDNDVVSLVNAQAADIPFGVAIANGASELKGELPNNMGDFIRGIAVHSHAYDNASLSNANGVPDKAMINVLRRGRVWAICEDGCSPEGDVFVRIAANGGNTQLGRLLGADDGANAGKLVGAVWKTTALAGGLAIVEINLMGTKGALT